MNQLYKKILKVFIVIVAISSTNFNFSTAQIIRCGVDDLTPAQVQAIRDQMNQYYALGKSAVMSQITIPVAVHVIRYDNGTGDVSDQAITAQIDVLNTTYSATNFQFVLHSTDRTNNTAWTTHLLGSANETNMKQSLAVDPSHNLNLYLCAAPVYQNSPLLGYATFPDMYPENSYMHGVVIKSTSVPGGSETNYNQGKTASHEIGHYLGLFHTFQNGCTSPGDDVDDTPYEATANTSACDDNRNTCSSPGNDPIHNYMDYSYDNCYYEFTSGQSDRMNMIVPVYRPSLFGITVAVEQRREDNSLMSGSSVARWENNTFQNYTVPITPFTLLSGSQETFRGQQSLVSNPNEKYYRWKANGIFETDAQNHHTFTIGGEATTLTSQFKSSNIVTIKNNLEQTSVNGDSIAFKDPWLIDYPDSNYGNTPRNRGMDAPLKSRTSPFTPDYTTSYNGDVYKGVFLNQGYNDPNKPYYSVKAVSPQDVYLSQTGKTHKFYFQNWSGSGAQIQYSTALETGVVFTSGSATVNANLKGHLLSDASLAFSGNGQRKLVRDAYGYYHAVYHTSEGIWYTRSTTSDFNGSWTADKLVTVIGVNPSIDIYGQNIKIVFEAYDEGIVYICLLEFNYSQWNGNIIVPTIIDECLLSLYPNIYPVVAFTQTELFIVYKKDNLSNLRYKRRYWDNNQQVWVDQPIDTLPNTDGSSCNPTLASRYTNDQIHIAWQQGETQIKYMYTYRKSFTRLFNTAETISTGSGNEKNKFPSISVHTGQIYPIVSWTGSYRSIADKIVAKENAEGLSHSRVTVRTKASSWGGFYYAGNDVNYSNSASVSSSIANSVISWSQSDGASSKWVKRIDDTYFGIYNLTYTGIIPHMSSGNDVSNLSQIKTLVFKKNTNPVFYAEKDNINYESNPMKKTEAVYDLTFGRRGVLFKDSLEFVYNVGDVLVNDDVIKFLPVSDTLPFTSLAELNAVLRTENFNLDENTQLYFSNFYRVLNTFYAQTVLSENDFVKFSVELLKAVDGTVIGEFDPVTYSVDNLYEKNTKDYQINCAGITAGEYFLRLKVESNIDISYALGNEYNDIEYLVKKHYSTTELFSEGVITSYDIAQNYPNPFNPSTTIRYQIPKDGMVALKVYDILGQEVTTLVNSFMNKGRYEVIFDASSLASGLYIYEIQSGDYKASKKMTLLK